VSSARRLAKIDDPQPTPPFTSNHNPKPKSLFFKPIPKPKPLPHLHSTGGGIPRFCFHGPYSGPWTESVEFATPPAKRSSEGKAYGAREAKNKRFEGSREDGA